MQKFVDFYVRSLSIGMKIHHVKMMKWASQATQAGILRSVQVRKN